MSNKASASDETKVKKKKNSIRHKSYPQVRQLFDLISTYCWTILSRPGDSSIPEVPGDTPDNYKSYESTWWGRRSSIYFHPSVPIHVHIISQVIQLEVFQGVCNKVCWDYTLWEKVIDGFLFRGTQHAFRIASPTSLY